MKNKIKIIEQIRKHGCLCAVVFLAFLIPVFFFLLVLRKMGIYPFGEKSALLYDMYDQLLGFMTSIRYIGEGGNTFFFSGSRSLGGNYLGLFAYYMGGPLSFILNLFPIEKIPEGIEFLIILKIGLSGLAFGVLAVYMMKKSGGVSVFRFLFVLPLCVAYALMTYNIFYGTLFPMWLDGVIFLPLIVLGIEKIFDNGNGWIYFILLTCLFYFNYYTGYMVGIFAALYFMCRWLCAFTKENHRLQGSRIGKFTFFSLLSIGLAMPLLAAVFTDLQKGRIGTENLWDEAYLFDNVLEFFRYLFLESQNLPTIFVGYLPLFLAVVFFFLKGIRKREKIAALVLNLFFLACFYFPPLYLVWHGLTWPQGFSFRFHFVYSFLLLFMALCTICVLLQKYGKTASKKIQGLRWAKGLVFVGLLAVTLLEGLVQGANADKIISMWNQMQGYKELGDYSHYLAKTSPLTEYIKEEDKDFYRINQLYENSKNDAMILGYNGMTHYSSTYNKKINDITLKLGFAQGWIWNAGYGATPIMNGLLGVRYILADKEIEGVYEKLSSTLIADLYKNNMDAGILYVAKVENDAPDLESDNPFENQTNFVNAITGKEESYYKPLQHEFYMEEKNGYVRFTAQDENPVYLSMDRFGAYFAQIYLNDEYVSDYFTAHTNCVLYLGTFAKGEEFLIRIEPPEYYELVISDVALVSCDIQKVDQLMKELSENTIETVKPNHGRLEGKFYVPQGCSIMTSIPYDEGWKVYVDGEKVKPLAFSDTFLVIPAQEGEHKVVMKYVSPGVEKGLVVFAVAALLLVFYICLSVMRKRNSTKNSWQN